MRFVVTASVRNAWLLILALGALLAPAVPVSAQSVGIGGRMAWVNPDTDVDVDSVHYYGGQLRLLSRRYGLEVAVDHHSEEFDLLNERVTETPVQVSGLLRMGSGHFAPFLLGGPGWYRRSVEPIEGSDISVSTTEFGWHAGGGLEILAGRHFGIHGDYRYTFLGDDDDDDDDDPGFIRGLLPGNRGSMWKLGATFYF
jgi:hypothetical protein